jgi:hypothetical protein
LELDMTTLSLLVMAGDAAGISEFLKTNEPSLGEVDELRLLITTNARFGGQACLSNLLKRSALGRVCGVIHADTIFQPGDFPAFVRTAMADKVCGIVGASDGPEDRSPEQKIVWGKNLEREAPVSTLDCCSIFFRTDIPVEFDERFSTWHCVNEDFCLSAAEVGFEVVVPPVRSIHRGGRTFHPAWQAEYHKYRRVLNDKWAGTSFKTT